MDQVSFGVFDWIDRGTGPVNRLYEERLKLLEAADDAGFFCYHLAEHHATPLGMAPSPALFLAAAAIRSSEADRRGCDARPIVGRAPRTGRRARRVTL